MARRRTRGSGSVTYRPRDHIWEGRVDEGWQDGKRKRTSFYGPTKLAVERAVRDAIHGLERGQAPTPAALTVSQWLARWLVSVGSRVRPVTWTRYRQIVRQLDQQLGHVRLARLSVADVSAAMVQLEKSGQSPRSVAHARAVLRNALTGAQREGLLAANVAALAHPPHVPAPNPTVLSSDAVEAILDACQPWLRRLVLVAVHTGVRQAEELGARWQDFAPDSRSLHVVTTLLRVPGGWALGEPKSATSRRVVALTEAATLAILEEQTAQNAAREAAGERWHEPLPGLIFTSDTGWPRGGTNLTRALQRALAAAGLPRLRWHDLRAAHGAFLLASGTDISVVSRKLGHSSVSLTSKFYGGVGEDLQREAAERLGRTLGRGRPSRLDPHRLD
jgi:integrase